MLRTLEQAQTELKELRASMAYAYAMGAGCGNAGNHPEYVQIRRRASELGAIIHEHRVDTR